MIDIPLPINVDALHERTPQVAPQVTPHLTPHVTPHVKRRLAIVDGELRRDELQERLGITERNYFRTPFLAPAMEAELLEMTGPASSTRLQRYRLTAFGTQVKHEL